MKQAEKTKLDDPGARERRIKFFDWGILVFGAIGTLMVLGNASKTILFYWGLLSAAISFLSLVGLVLGLFIENRDASERRLQMYYALSNLVPAIVFCRLLISSWDLVLHRREWWTIHL